MNRSTRLWTCVALCMASLAGVPRSAEAQQSWLDFGAALPRVNMQGFNQGLQGGYMSPGLQNTTTSVTYPTQGWGGSWLGGPRKDWKLGAYVQNTDIGAIVQQVLPGSAAQQAGLEPQDVVVAIAGNRIGQFDNRIVDIGDEVRRSADMNGRVSVLVQKARTQRLQAMLMSLNSSSSSAAGTIALRDQQSLPIGSLLTVQLQNVSRPFYEITGGKSVTRAEGFGPYRFELNYDPQYIDPRDQYVINAVITVNGQIVYSLPQPFPVNVATLNQPFSLVLDRSTFAGNQGGLAGFPGAGFPGNSFPGGNVISAGYATTPDYGQLTSLFQQLLVRSPSQRELLAWQSYLQQGKSLSDVRNKIIASQPFRDRFGNDDVSYVQNAFTLLTNRQPDPNEVAYLMQRLQATGSTEGLIADILSQSR